LALPEGPAKSWQTSENGKVFEVSREKILVAAVALAGALTAQARDLTLAEAETLLVQKNRELQAARRGVESAEAQTVIAGARPNATFSVNSVSINDSNTIDNQKRGADTVFRIDQPFERGNKRGLRLDAAASLQRASRNDFLDVLRQQLATLRGAYYDLRQAQEKADTLAQNAELFSGTLSAAERRLKAGDLASADVAKVQVDYERAQNDARAALADRTRAQIALAYLIAAERDAAELRAVDPWPPPQRADELAIEEAIESRPDVVAAKERVQAAERLRDLARAQRTRDVTLGAQYERWIPGGVPTNSIGVGISVPIFTGYDFSGDIQKAEVDRYAAMDALARARAIAGAELRRAAADLNASAERVERFDRSLLGAATRSAEASEFAFQRGAISVLEVLDARRTLAAVRLEALAARADYAKALAAWRAAQASVQSLELR
jgi:cobalt-zinc-cadmium efflux system outer membrane protein